MDDKLLADHEWVLKRMGQSPAPMFLSYFMTAFMYADTADRDILKPALDKIRVLYPLKVEPLNEVVSS